MGKYVMRYIRNS